MGNKMTFKGKESTNPELNMKITRSLLMAVPRLEESCTEQSSTKQANPHMMA